MLSKIVLLVAFVAVAAANDLPGFRRDINKSKLECNRENRLRSSNVAEVRATCPPPADSRGRTPRRDVTTGELLAMIPGGLRTVQSYSAGRVRGDLHKTAQLCEERESDDGAKSWKNIERTARIEMRLTPRDEVYAECKKQMDREKQDCDAVKYLLCAFSQRQAFECAPTSQRDRTAGTIDNTDHCFQMANFNYGRPADLREFRARQRASKLNCRRDTDLIEGRCGRRDETLQQIMAALPTERAYDFARDVRVARADEVQNAVNECLLIERLTLGQLNRKAAEVYKGNPSGLRACRNTLRDNRLDRCRQVKDIMCAYSYGTDLSCKSAQQTLLQDNACDRLIGAIGNE